MMNKNIKCTVRHRCKAKWKCIKCNRCSRNKGYVKHSGEFAQWLFRDFYERSR